MISLHSNCSVWRQEQLLSAPLHGSSWVLPTCSGQQGPGILAEVGKSGPFPQTQPSEAPHAQTGLIVPTVHHLESTAWASCMTVLTEGKILACFPCPHFHPLQAPSERKCFGTEVGMCVLSGGPCSLELFWFSHK